MEKYIETITLTRKSYDELVKKLNEKTELVDYKVQNELLKKENEKYKKLYNELIQEKIDTQMWEYLGGKKK